MIKKKIIGFLGAVALVWAIGLFSDPALAALSFGGLVGWYSPNFGEVNSYLAHRNTIWDTDWKFEEGIMYGAAVEYEITPNFKLRGEWNSFNAETSDYAD